MNQQVLILLNRLFARISEFVENIDEKILETKKINNAETTIFSLKRKYQP